MINFALGIAFGILVAPLWKKYAWPRLAPKLAVLWAKVV